MATKFYWLAPYGNEKRERKTCSSFKTTVQPDQQLEGAAKCLWNLHWEKRRGVLFYISFLTDSVNVLLDNKCQEMPWLVWLVWLERSLVHLKIMGSILGQGTYLGVGFNCWLGPMREATYQCISLTSVFLSLAFSPFLPL